MSIHPSSSFPLLISDQADVIQLFLELMREHDNSPQPRPGPRMAATKDLRKLREDVHDSWYPGSQQDHP